MAIHIRSDVEREIERIQAKLQRDFGMKISKTNTVRYILEDYKSRGNY